MGLTENILAGLSTAELKALEKTCLPGTDSQPGFLFALLLKYGDEEDKVTNRFKKEWPRGNLSVVRTQLNQLILGGLYRLYAKDEPAAEVNELIYQTQFFAKKSAYDIAVKLLDRAQDIAEENELFPQLSELLDLRLLFYQTRILSDESGKRETVKQIKEVMLKQQNRMEYQLLVFEQMEWLHQSFMLRTPEGLAKFEAILKSPLMEAESNALSIKARIDYFILRGQYFSISNQFERASESLQMLVDLLDENPAIKKQRNLTYFSTYSQLATYGYILKDAARMEHAIGAIEQSPKYSEIDRIGAATLLINTKLAYYDLLKDKKGLYETVLEARDLLRIHASKLKPDVRATLLLTVISTFVELGEYDEVLVLMREFAPFIYSNERVDIKVYLFFYELIAQLEIGNELIVNDTLQNFNRFMLRNEFKSAFERVMVQFLKIVSSAKPDMKGDLKQLLEQLRELPEKSLLDQNRVMFDILENLIQSRIAGKKFHEFLREAGKRG
ncbi:MAG: hypothetical protein U0T73_12455 [Chitinophagales bacterium]